MNKTDAAGDYLTSLAAVGTPIFGAVAVLGAISNGLSLSYFVTRTKDSIGNQLLVILNIFDTLVCLNVLLAYGAPHHLKGILTPGPMAILQLVIFWFDVVTTMVSGLVTAYLCLVRTLSIVHPLYRVSKGGLYGSMGVIVTGIIFQFTFQSVNFMHHIIISVYEDKAPKSSLVYFNCWMTLLCFSEIIIIILIVLTACAISIKKLMAPNPTLGQKQITESNRKASYTVLSLSSVFVISNGLASILFIHKMATILPNIDRNSEFMETNTSRLVYGMNLTTIIANSMFPLNSLLNPVIYMLRIESFRVYTRNLVRRLICALQNP